MNFTSMVFCKIKLNIKMSNIVDRFRPQELVLYELIPTIICQQQQDFHLVRVVYLRSLRLVMTFWIALSTKLAQKAKLASGSSSRSFYGPIAAWDKDSGEIYSVKTDLKLAMIMLVLYDQKKPISSRGNETLCRNLPFDDWVRQSKKIIKLCWLICLTMIF